jgi:hypothetical protein
MSDAWRFSIARLLFVTAVIGIAIAGWAKSHHLKQERDRIASLVDPRKMFPPSDSQIRHLPMTITVSDYGGNRATASWFATINSAGDGLLDISNLDSPDRSEFAVAESQFTELREALIKERFFLLPDEVGSAVPDAPTQSITVVLGQYSKTVRIQYLGNLANVPPHVSSRGPQLAAARTLRVWLLARGWFSDPRVPDRGSYDRQALGWLDPGNESNLSAETSNDSTSD